MLALCCFLCHSNVLKHWPAHILQDFPKCIRHYLFTLSLTVRTCLAGLRGVQQPHWCGYPGCYGVEDRVPLPVPRVLAKEAGATTERELINTGVYSIGAHSWAPFSPHSLPFVWNSYSEEILQKTTQLGNTPRDTRLDNTHLDNCHPEFVSTLDAQSWKPVSWSHHTINQCYKRLHNLTTLVTS